MLRFRPAARWRLGALLLAVTAAILLQGGSVPHTHVGVGPGLYNQDHDLALLATLHGAAALAATQTAPVVLAVVITVTSPATDRAASAPRPSADSRAPPRS